MYKKVSVQWGGRELSIETGKIAKQADGAVTVSYGGSMVLVTVVADKRMSEPGDFIPLTVNYQEKYYATGKVPGGFFKREGRPTDFETLSCRLIDRPVRPLFPKNWFYETQIIPTVFSSDLASNPAVLAMIGASAALEVSHIPFEGPLAATQIIRVGDEWVFNPGYAQLEESDVELVVAGNRNGVLMVEGGASMVPEEEFLEGIFKAYEFIQPVLEIQEELREAVGVPKTETEPIEAPPKLKDRTRELVGEELDKSWRIPGKVERHQALRELWSSVHDKLVEEEYDLGPGREIYFSRIKDKMEKDVLRRMIIEEGTRADGRKFEDVRPVSCEVEFLPRVHGSALFQRGETQALVVSTLGTRKDERKIERLEEDYYKTFYLHYNFPPYSVGEVKGRLGPGRREIGHGYLAERALARVMPGHEDFPYTVRVVSEITESNGSSSMASVCGGSMSLMDAGVPVLDQVAGVAMGLVKEDEGKFHVLTDIMGDEDHCGDMDFKVAGTSEGVTAVQMDIKISGLDRSVMSRALEQARKARLHILEEMNKAISRPRPELSPNAPRIVTVQVPIEKIKDVIGPGGKMIRSIVEETGAEIDVEDDGTVRISSTDMETNDKAKKIIEDLTEVAEVGKVYTGKVTKVMDFGAFVSILPNTEGLIHISRMENYRIEKVTDVLQEGDPVVVKVVDIDDNGKISLSRKDVLDQQPEGARKPPRQEDKEKKSPPRGSRPYRGPEGGDKDKGEGRRKPPHKKKRPGRDNQDDTDDR
ncbi:MAG: polyribonucleotide nucleotidyltransferase [bacterium]